MLRFLMWKTCGKKLYPNSSFVRFRLIQCYGNVIRCQAEFSLFALKKLTHCCPTLYVYFDNVDNFLKLPVIPFDKCGINYHFLVGTELIYLSNLVDNWLRNI